MRYRACFSFLLLLGAAACATATESPTAPPSLAFSPADDGEKPPPPLDTGDVAVNVNYDGAFARVAARYFANTQGTNVWIAFESNEFVTASPNARLQYNPKSGRTHGGGTLTFADGSVRPIDLSTISLSNSTLGSCTSNPTTDRVGCGTADLFIGGRKVGSISVSPKTTRGTPIGTDG
jgi:hypothetical protein